MLPFIVRRLMFIPITAITISAITFFFLRAWPDLTGDPAKIICGMNCPEERYQTIRAELGLDRPMLVQYGEWVKDVATGNLGTTYYGGNDVLEEITRRMPISFEIMVLILISGPITGITLGTISALTRNTLIDYVLRFLAVLGQSVPEFFLLVLLIVIPSILWNYAAPVGGFRTPWEDPMTNFRMFVPPVLLVSVAGAAGLMRFTRSMMLEVLRSDYIRTARSKGLHPRVVITRHALRNTMAPLITALTPLITIAFSGTLILEVVMSIDGLGAFFFRSVMTRDLPVVQFTVLYTALIVILVNQLQDVLYAYIDPRIRFR